jgi:hypothetical protein
VPMVHPCARPGCEMLTMGDYCVEHEQGVAAHRRLRHAVPRVGTATALLAVAVLGALIRTRLLR